MNNYFDWAHTTYHFSIRAQKGSRPGTESADNRKRRQPESGDREPVRSGQTKQPNPR